MDETYRKAKLAEANDAVGAARDAVIEARTAKARRAASEDLEFWTSRRAFLSVPEMAKS